MKRKTIIIVAGLWRKARSRCQKSATRKRKEIKKTGSQNSEPVFFLCVRVAERG